MKYVTAKNTWAHLSKIINITDENINTRVWIEANSTGNTVQIKNIMLEEGTETDYVPHQEQRLPITELDKAYSYNEQTHITTEGDAQIRAKAILDLNSLVTTVNRLELEV